MKRRDFIQQSALTGLGLSIFAGNLLTGCSTRQVHSAEFRKLTFDLLKEWCDGMIKMQVIDPGNPESHGLLECPACNTVHTRCFDAVYPFLYMAKETGDKKYLDAGIAVFEWSENVTRPDGAWTNELKPKSWDGITAFGAVSLAEALKYHGDLLDNESRARWMDRLERAAEFTYKKFTKVDTTNVNYGASCIYVFNLLGHVLNEPKYIARSKELAAEVKAYFTKPNAFLYGEIKPTAHKLSAKGLHGIDLGYNIEETLNSLVMYALEENDEELLELATKSMNTHLEFMLPDGGWDNSWGTRMFKWTYWGSRTSDGSQQCLALLANQNPACGTAAIKYTELLKRCTTDGLLHGGLHYVSHGIKPCIHHTFEHAKPLVSILEHWDRLPEINTTIPLPRAAADGVKYFEELDLSLFARGDWRGTISAYDAEYYDKNDLRQATGGSLAMLYHNKVGLVCTASMAIYKLGEVYNQQPAPGEDIALTPRIETYENDVWFTNLFDLAATFSSSDDGENISFLAKTKLKNESREVVENTASKFEIAYDFSAEMMRIQAKTTDEIKGQTAFVLPIVSPTGEQVNQVSSNEITIQKPEGVVKVLANVPLRVKEMPRSRTFNMVPGVEAVPVVAAFEMNNEIKITIEVV
ncbi:glycoside hydrolase family protein [Draconibacterium sediminis]|uniref:Alginate lyase domain-containing protein n=1 Tax=Draconibacterium sediminis TaxID=1544798 RepID=A0A0D8J9F0_9BACT|nr:hypothetical protein [Draconibacterium sediminis]KJF43527.1 hypothetical protein LH29_15075 [Draconibacterium sediminis]